MNLVEPVTRPRRVMLALFVISLACALLLTTFFATQVVHGADYALQSESNRLRPVVIPAPRGTIYDRYGEIVATSIPGFGVFVTPDSAEIVQRTLQDLSPFLGLSSEDVQRLLERWRARPYDLLEVAPDATLTQVAQIEERRSSFPSVLIVDRPKRHYPSGAAVGHLIGYVSEITRDELQMPVFRDRGYRQGRWIGKAGIERQYEFELTGVDGARFVEVDARGRIINPRSSVSHRVPRPGNDLQLTLDLRLQRYIAEIFPDTMTGALVAMVPSTGEILAMYSHPSFDPNDFVGGIHPRLWRALQGDPLNPLLDRTIAALYPPASTFKLATASAGIAKGFLTADTRMPIPCTGGLLYAGRYSRCWKAEGHGSLTLAQAIEQSCNVYFYQVGIRLGLSELTAYGTRVGFGRRTGIDLPAERSGHFPDGPEYYLQREKFVAPAQVMFLAIGQGPNDQSVLRMAHFYSAIAGNGTAPEPHLRAADEGNGPGAIDLGLSPRGLGDLWEGLEMVTKPGGTAFLSSLDRWQIYGKTGTAENPHGPAHGWFVGFSGRPGGHPEIAVAAIVEHGLHGSDVAPLAAKAISFYLDRKYGYPFDAQPTLIERWNSGRKGWGAIDSYAAPLTPGVPPVEGSLASFPNDSR